MKLAALLLSALAVPASAQLMLEPVATIDLVATANPLGGHYIGTHPAAIGYLGIDTFLVAGTNAGGASGTGVVRVAVGSGAAVYGPVLTFMPGTPAGFGYTGAHGIAAAYDPGFEHPEGLQAFDGWTRTWAASARGSSGVVYHDHPSGEPRGMAWLSIGSDRRALNDPFTGAPIYTHADGMVVNPGGNAVWRDIALDPIWQDYFARRSSDVVRVTRAGPNSGTPTTIVDLPDADDVAGQSVEVLPTGAARFVVFNARASTAYPQSFFDVVRVVTDSGAPVTVNWGTFAPPLGAGQYDFAYMPGVEHRLAVLDVLNRRLTIFRILAQPFSTPVCAGDGTGAPCPCGNTGAPGRGCANTHDVGGGRLVASGVSSRSADTLVLHGSSMPNGAALYFQGTMLADRGAGAPFGDGLRCAAGAVLRLGLRTNVAGASSFPGPGDPPISSHAGIWITIAYQIWYRNAAPFCTSATFNLTNGLVVGWAP